MISRISLKDISVIVPLAPREEAWKGFVEDLGPFFERFAEIIFVVTHKSHKSALRNKSSLIPIQIKTTAPGRAKQLNAGARTATAKYLWFVHADSRLGPKPIMALEKALNQGPNALHYFNLAFLKDGPPLMWVNRIGCWIRSQLLGVPFGDQGFCLSKKLFFALGGFPENAPYGEDHLFIWKVRQNDIPLNCIPATIQTSARRYAQQGWAKLTLRYAHRWIRQAWPEWKKLRKGKGHLIRTTTTH